MNKEELIAFEDWTVEQFNQGKLKSPVHLSGGNESQLIEIFKDIRPNDWVFTTYRSHYHALLKGVPENRLKDWILDNKSIHFMDSEFKVFSSAIVGGCLPIALGTAMAIKIKNEKTVLVNAKTMIAIEDSRLNHVYCFVGDMTASLGLLKDCVNYAYNNKLPITFIIEDNGLSTDTKTHEAWGCSEEQKEIYLKIMSYDAPDMVRYYKYKRVWPHYGSGQFVASLWKDIIDKEDPRKKGF